MNHDPYLKKNCVKHMLNMHTIDIFYATRWVFFNTVKWVNLAHLVLQIDSVSSLAIVSQMQVTKTSKAGPKS